jgi:RsiW-degrading membrane proteinase PrsW (M82 family)
MKKSIKIAAKSVIICVLLTIAYLLYNIGKDYQDSMPCMLALMLCCLAGVFLCSILENIYIEEDDK